MCAAMIVSGHSVKIDNDVMYVTSPTSRVFVGICSSNIEGNIQKIEYIPEDNKIRVYFPQGRYIICSPTIEFNVATLNYSPLQQLLIEICVDDKLDMVADMWYKCPTIFTKAILLHCFQIGNPKVRDYLMDRLLTR